MQCTAVQDWKATPPCSINRGRSQCKRDVRRSATGCIYIEVFRVLPSSEGH